MCLELTKQLIWNDIEALDYEWSSGARIKIRWIIEVARETPGKSTEKNLLANKKA